MLQNTGGLIMENALTQFQRIAAFQPIINGNVISFSFVIQLIVLLLHWFFSIKCFIIYLLKALVGIWLRFRAVECLHIYIRIKTMINYHQVIQKIAILYSELFSERVCHLLLYIIININKLWAIKTLSLCKIHFWFYSLLYYKSFISWNICKLFSSAQ